MRMQRSLLRAAVAVALLVFAVTPAAAQYPAPKEGDWIARDFRFHTGEVMPELRLHYTTVGEPTGEPVLILHGTTGSGAGMLSPAFARRAVRRRPAAGREQVLHHPAGRHRPRQIVQALRRPAHEFPRYNYDDMVAAQYRLVTEVSASAACAWCSATRWAACTPGSGASQHPDFMDALVPMASQPTEMSSRNWMMRRLIIDSIRNDPDWKNGNYTTQPRALQVANVFFGIATNGGTLAYQKLAPTREHRRQAARRSAWRRRSTPTPTTSSTSGTPRATTTRRRASSASRRRCWPSTPPTTSATRRRPASWSASSSA